jgi:hypothetical protein
VERLALKALVRWAMLIQRVEGPAFAQGFGGRSNALHLGSEL